MHPIRAVLSLAASITVIGAMAWPSLAPLPFDAGSAYAQSRNAQPKTAAPKQATRKQATPKQATPKIPLPKQGEKEQPARTPFTLEDEAVATVAGIADARVWGDTDTDFQRVLPTASGPWLSLSGGGADGAFGAGLLTGWSQAGNRPEFAVVTGASIGALIGPYAFLGSGYDEELRKNFTSITAADVFEDHATAESLLDSWPLKRLIEQRMTREMLAAIAAEHRKGRRLLVATTNLDAGRRVVWNMGAIAERGDDKALKLFRDILLASSSIPGFFQPVPIEVEANGKKFQEMHLDGTITAPFFIMPESMLGAGNARLPTDQVYVVVNSKLTPEFGMPERKVNSILARTIGVALTTALRAELLLVTAGAQRLGLKLSVAYVPETFQELNRGLFDHIYMQALFDFGAEQAKKGAAFENILAGAAERRTDAPR